MTLQELFAKVMRMKRGTRSREVIEIADDLEEVMRSVPADCPVCLKRQAADEKTKVATRARVAAHRKRRAAEKREANA